MSLVRLPDEKMESAGNERATLNDQVSASMRDVLHMTFDRWKFGIHCDLGAEKYARSLAGPLLLKIWFHGLPASFCN